MFWDIFFIVLASIILLGMIIISYSSWVKYRDKSVDIKEGMNEEKVLEIMGSDPISIEQLKNNNYEWVYERREWKGWGTEVLKIEIIFSSSNVVTSIVRNRTYEKNKQ